MNARIAIAVIALAAIGCFAGPGPLQIEASVMGVGHAYTAVHLDHFVGYDVEHVAHLGLGEADQFGNVWAIIVDGGQGRFHSAARQFQIRKHLCRPVLQGLEGPDHLTKLNANLKVVQCGLEGLHSGTEHFSTDAGPGAVEDLFQNRIALIGFTKHGVGTNLDLIEGNVCTTTAVGQGKTLAANALCIGGDNKQGDPVLIARLT